MTEVRIQHSRFESLLHIVEALFLPIVLVYLAHLVSDRQREAERFAALVPLFTSESADARRLALMYPQYLHRTQGLTAEYLFLIAENASAAPQRDTSERAAQMLQMIEREGTKDPRGSSALATSLLNSLRRRVYIKLHDRAPETDQLARTIGSVLSNEHGVISRNFDFELQPPKQHELWFYVSTDKGHADDIVMILKAQGIGVLAVDHTSDTNRPSRPRTFDLHL